MNMARKKATKRKPTEFFLTCECGAKARVFELEGKGFMSHYPGCGALSFFHDPALLERLRFGGQLCPHHPQAKTMSRWTYNMVPDMPSENILL